MTGQGLPWRQLINKKLVRRRFDRHAHEYDRFARVQRKMAQVLMEQLASPVRANAILELGCGTGSLTLELRERFPDAELTAVDLSPAMIAETRRKLGSRGRGVTLITGDAETVIPQFAERRTVPFDLIVSNATFQWFNEPARTALACVNCLSQGGSFAFSTLIDRTFEELKQSFQAAETLLGQIPAAHGQPLASADDWRRTFANHGVSFRWKEELHREIYPSIRAFLHSVKRIGAGNAVNLGTTGPGLAGKALFEAMERHYCSHYAHGSGIRATYHIGYGIIHRVVDSCTL